MIVIYYRAYRIKNLQIYIINDYFSFLMIPKKLILTEILKGYWA